MELKEAIEEVKREFSELGDWTDSDVYATDDYRQLAAIATILNAVVKGELVAADAIRSLINKDQPK